jgi:hypothetical protein
MGNTLKIKRGLAAGVPQGQLAEPLFTTDTYDLYIGKGSGGNQRFQKYIASGTTSQYLRGDGSLATHDLDSLTDVVITSASSGQVLKYDGTNWVNGTDTDTGITSLNGLTATTQTFATGTSGTDFGISSAGSTHTFNLPTADATNTGKLSSTDWSTFNSKEPAITASTSTKYWRGDKTFQTLDTSVVPENGPIYFTEPRVLATVLTGLNLSGGGTIAATDSVLTAFGKIQNQISGIAGGVNYQGTWNASTNSPTLTSSIGTKGYYYVVTVAGSTNLNGITDWKVGDWAIFNGTAWDKVDNTDAVSSVNGFTGAVNLGLGDISNVTLTSPTNAQLLRFNGTSSKWENWTPTYISGNQTITLSGDVSGSGTTAITTTIGALKVTNAMLAGSIDYAKMDATTVPTWNQNTTGQAGSVANSITFNNGGAGAASGTTFNGSAARTISYNTIGAQPLLTNPVTGTGTSGQIAYFNGTSSITSSSTFTFSPTAQFTVSNNATTGLIGVDILSTVNALANNDILYGVRINPTFSVGSFTGVTQRALGVFGNVYINGNITGAGWQGSVIGSSYGGAGTVSGILKANGSGTVSAAVAGTDYVVPSALSGYLPLTGGTLTGALSGTSATFSGSILSNTSVKVNASAGFLLRTDSDTANVGGFTRRSYLTGTAADPTIFAASGYGLYFYVDADTNRGLTLSNTGAATFSSSVTATGYAYISSNSNSVAAPNIQFTDTYVSAGRNWAIVNGYDAYGTLSFKVSSAIGGAPLSGTSVLSITQSGAATFSSSVAATKIAINDTSTSFTPLYLNSEGNYASSGNMTKGFAISNTTAGRALNMGVYEAGAYAWMQAAYINNANVTFALALQPNGGNVGIGTSSPSSLFEVSGTNSVITQRGGTGYSVLRLYGGDETNADVVEFQIRNRADGANNSSIGNYSNHDLLFRTNNTEKMRITSGGATQIKGTLATYAPGSSTTLGPTYKFGSRMTGTCNTSTTAYLEVEVGGTTYYLAFANPL